MRYGMMNRILSMFQGRMRRRNNWGRWMSVLAAFGIGATAAGMARGRGGRIAKMMQRNQSER